VNVINLHQKCANHGCTKPATEYTQLCYACHRDGIDKRTKINYARVHREIAAYLEENWSLGKITRIK
jgi:hypothetical protein